MNAENIDAICKVLSETKNFSMLRWRHECGTPACIGGHIQNLVSKNGREDLVSEFLGIPYSQAKEICYPSVGLHPFFATKEQAILLLQNLKKTGEVDWSAAMMGEVK